MSQLILLLLLQSSPGQLMDRAVEAGIDAGVYPGAVVVVGTADTVLYARGYGHFTWRDDSPVPDPGGTLWDLASLTKVVATTPAVMLLADRGRIALDSPVVRYLPEFNGVSKNLITVSDLLVHRSGLRAFLPLNELAGDAAEARRLVLEEPLRWQPRTRTVYSDLNAMLLGWIVEAVTGTSLDRYATDNLFDPMGMSETRFKPPREERSRTAPVGLWRGHAISGEVHDQNAARLGGVSGHAGLYSTGLDLARYARFWLRRGKDEGGRFLVSPGMVEVFMESVAGNRALGWEVRDTTSTDNSGSRLSPRAIGHTGYTGTSIWIDPVRDMFVILLTNRVYAPGTRRSITELKRVRGRVADLAVELVESRCGTSGARDGLPAGC